MADASILEDGSSIEIKTHSNLKFTSFQHGNNNWHGSISLSNNMTQKIAKESNESKQVGKANDDDGRQLFDNQIKLENNVNMIEMGLMPNDAHICSFPHEDSTWVVTSVVTPLPSDIIELPLSTMAPDGGDMDKKQHQQLRKQQVNKEKYSQVIEHVLILSYLAIFGILGIFIRYALQILFGPHVANVTNDHSALYIDLPSNMVGSFFIGWVGVAFKNNIIFFSQALAIGLSSGLMGSITTFSSWTQVTINLITEGNWITGIIGLLLGMELSQMSLILGIESAKFMTYIHQKISKKQLVLTWMPSYKYNHMHLYGFIMLMFIIGILWGGSLVLVVLDFTSHHKTRLWIACMVGPFGVWIRWFLARLNGQGIGAQKHFKWLPTGTLLANFMASIMMASLSTIHLLVKDRTTRVMIEGLELGFIGCLSTVSTFLVEVHAMHKSSHSWRAYFYILLSLCPALFLGTLICSIPIWIGVYS